MTIIDASIDAGISQGLNGKLRQARTSASGIHRKMMAWGLLASWLIYSAAALGWHLARDPMLSAYVCMRR